jgi:hypothetical protein
MQIIKPVQDRIKRPKHQLQVETISEEENKQPQAKQNAEECLRENGVLMEPAQDKIKRPDPPTAPPDSEPQAKRNTEENLRENSVLMEPVPDKIKRPDPPVAPPDETLKTINDTTTRAQEQITPPHMPPNPSPINQQLRPHQQTPNRTLNKNHHPHGRNRLAVVRPAGLLT